MAEVTFLEAIRQGIFEEMEKDERVFVIGEDVGIYGGAFKVTEGLLDRFGSKRVIDTPISEAPLSGLSRCSHDGMRPIAEMQFIDFISCGFDQLTNARPKCVIVGDKACQWSCAGHAGRSSRRSISFGQS